MILTQHHLKINVLHQRLPICKRKIQYFTFYEKKKNKKKKKTNKQKKKLVFRVFLKIMKNGLKYFVALTPSHLIHVPRW